VSGNSLDPGKRGDSGHRDTHGAAAIQQCMRTESAGLPGQVGFAMAFAPSPPERGLG
jgi:hypothetical protein